MTAIRRLIPAIGLTLVAAAPARAQDTLRIELAKMRPKGLLVDRYSYMNQPYSYHHFHHIDELGFRIDRVARSGAVHQLTPAAAPFEVRYSFGGKTHSLEDYFARSYVTGFLVLQDDRILVERYFHGADRSSRFVSQSVGKSVLSILIGAAVDAGKIDVSAPVTRYLPELATSGYRDATVKNLLQMATGVDYTENYRDSTSGAALIGAALVSGRPTFEEFVKSIKPTAVRPGTQFQYQSVNTQVLGLLLERVTGQKLNHWAQEKLWSKLGAEADAYFYEAKSQPSTCAFACFNATVRDYARIGLMMMRNGKLGADRIVSERWVKESTTPDAKYLEPGSAASGRPGYAYQWWVPPGHPGAFMASGIYGQSIYVDPAKHLVVVQTSAWPQAEGGPELYGEFSALRDAITRKL